MNEGTEQTETADAGWAVEQRWGDLSGAGFTALPNTLIKAQAELDLTANDMVVLTNLIMHWWRPNKMPFPRTSTIAKRSGLSARTVQRSMQKMQRQGYIEKVLADDRFFFDLSGIKNVLEKISGEHAWATERSRP